MFPEIVERIEATSFWIESHPKVRWVALLIFVLFCMSSFGQVPNY